MLVSWEEEKRLERLRKAKGKSSPSSDSGRSTAGAKVTKGKAKTGKSGKGNEDSTGVLPPSRESQELIEKIVDSAASSNRPGMRSLGERKGSGSTGVLTPGQGSHAKERGDGHSDIGGGTGPGDRADPGIQPSGGVPTNNPRKVGLDTDRGNRGNFPQNTVEGNESQVPMFGEGNWPQDSEAEEGWEEDHDAPEAVNA